MAHFPSSALSKSRRACLPRRLRLPSIAQMSACVSVTASGVSFASTCLFAERSQLFLPQRICIASNVGEGILYSLRDSAAPDQLEARRALSFAGLNVPQSFCRRFQLVKIRLANQHGMILAA